MDASKMILDDSHSSVTVWLEFPVKHWQTDVSLLSQICFGPMDACKMIFCFRSNNDDKTLMQQNIHATKLWRN